MAAREIVQSNLVDKAPRWRSEDRGTGESRGDAGAGTSTQVSGYPPC
jgi:hypothetical protein